MSMGSMGDTVLHVRGRDGMSILQNVQLHTHNLTYHMFARVVSTAFAAVSSS